MHDSLPFNIIPLQSSKIWFRPAQFAQWGCECVLGHSGSQILSASGWMSLWLTPKADRWRKVCVRLFQRNFCWLGRPALLRCHVCLVIVCLQSSVHMYTCIGSALLKTTVISPIHSMMLNPARFMFRRQAGTERHREVGKLKALVQWPKLPSLSCSRSGALQLLSAVLRRWFQPAAAAWWWHQQHTSSLTYTEMYLFYSYIPFHVNREWLMRRKFVFINGIEKHKS